HPDLLRPCPDGLDSGTRWDRPGAFTGWRHPCTERAMRTVCAHSARCCVATGGTTRPATPGRLPAAGPDGTPVRAPRLRPVAGSAVERGKVADQLTLQGRCMGEDLVQRLGDRTGHCAGADAT